MKVRCIKRKILSFIFIFITEIFITQPQPPTPKINLFFQIQRTKQKKNHSRGKMIPLKKYKHPKLFLSKYHIQ